MCTIGGRSAYKVEAEHLNKLHTVRVGLVTARAPTGRLDVVACFALALVARAAAVLELLAAQAAQAAFALVAAILALKSHLLA